MLETLAGMSTAGRNKREVRILAEVETHQRLEQIAKEVKAGNITMTDKPGNGGVCFCGKTNLKESTVLTFSKPITLVDFRGEPHTGQTFNLGNECINTFRLWLH